MKPECDRIHSMHHMTVITITYIPELLGPAFLLRVILEVILPHFVTIHKDSLVLVACIQNFICVTPVGHFGSLHRTWRLYYWYQSLLWISLLPWWFLLEGEATSLYFPNHRQCLVRLSTGNSRAIETAVVRNESVLYSDLAPLFLFFSVLQYNAWRWKSSSINVLSV